MFLGRMGKKDLKSAGSTYQSTPSRLLISSAYASVKFHYPPLPKMVPKPPIHWLNNGNRDLQNNCAEITNVLKIMLKVQT